MPTNNIIALYIQNKYILISIAIHPYLIDKCKILICNLCKGIHQDTSNVHLSCIFYPKISAIIFNRISTFHPDILISHDILSLFCRNLIFDPGFKITKFLSTQSMAEFRIFLVCCRYSQVLKTLPCWLAPFRANERVLVPVGHIDRYFGQFF